MIAASFKQWPWVKPAIDFLFPPLCQGCGEFCDDPDEVCAKCLAQMPPYLYPFCSKCHNPILSGTACPECKGRGVPLFAYSEYSGPLQKVIVNFKFGSAQGIASLFGRLIAEEHGQDILKTKPDMLVPVPLHSSREYYRGYNQAVLLARELSRHLQIETMPDLVERIHRRKPQSSLTMAERPANVRGAYRLSESTDLRRRVILVDDVVTSGATVGEVKRIVEAGGHTVAGLIAIAWAGGGHD